MTSQTVLHVLYSVYLLQVTVQCLRLIYETHGLYRGLATSWGYRWAYRVIQARRKNRLPGLLVAAPTVSLAVTLSAAVGGSSGWAIALAAVFTAQVVTLYAFCRKAVRRTPRTDAF